MKIFQTLGFMVIVVAGLAFLPGCDDDGGGEGTWVVHKGGTVCKGYDASRVAGNDVYVATDGSDDNSGTSADQPFETLAKALCNAAPGQTVHVALGTYKESVLLSEFGSSSNPITITGETNANGDFPMMDGDWGNEQYFTYGIAIIGEDEEHKSAGFVIENIAFRNYTDAGILAVISDDITIRDCMVTDCGFNGINPDNSGEGFGFDLIEIDRLLVTGIEATRNGPEEEVGPQRFLGNDVSVWGCTEVEVSDSYMHNSMGGGLLIEDSVNVLVENNRMKNSELEAADYWDGALWLDGGHDVIVRNNTISGNHGPGLLITDEGVQYPNGSYGYVIDNNTITNNLWGISIWNFGVCPWPDDSIIDVNNNNTVSGNTTNYKCSEWECGVGQPCD